MGIRSSFTRGKATGAEAEHSPLSRFKFKNGRSCRTIYTFICLYVLDRENFISYLSWLCVTAKGGFRGLCKLQIYHVLIAPSQNVAKERHMGQGSSLPPVLYNNNNRILNVNQDEAIRITPRLGDGLPRNSVSVLGRGKTLCP